MCRGPRTSTEGRHKGARVNRALPARLSNRRVALGNVDGKRGPIVHEDGSTRGYCRLMRPAAAASRKVDRPWVSVAVGRTMEGRRSFRDEVGATPIADSARGPCYGRGRRSLRSGWGSWAGELTVVPSKAVLTFEFGGAHGLRHDRNTCIARMLMDGARYGAKTGGCPTVAASERRWAEEPAETQEKNGVAWAPAWARRDKAAQHSHTRLRVSGRSSQNGRDADSRYRGTRP
ncbi:hypothetical protein C8Q78DRAFT_790208 [Trametes maxima]|nr:hypothetical protein C8Q78DRAFT_790208 [Trametes maxima]